ncbi:MAG: hypothetical protein ABW128_04050 [Rhizorhabdus sp.]
MSEGMPEEAFAAVGAHAALKRVAKPGRRSDVAV